MRGPLPDGGLPAQEGKCTCMRRPSLLFLAFLAVSIPALAQAQDQPQAQLALDQLLQELDGQQVTCMEPASQRLEAKVCALLDENIALLIEKIEQNPYVRDQLAPYDENWYLSENGKVARLYTRKDDEDSLVLFSLTRINPVSTYLVVLSTHL